MTWIEIFTVFGAEYLIFVVGGVAVLLAVWRKEIRLKLAIVFMCAAPLAYLMARLAGLLYYHEQPFLAWGGTPLIPHVIDNTFPSDHVLLAATLASSVFLFNRKVGLALWTLVVLIAAARVAAGLHYPVDVAASAALAIGTVAGVYLLLRQCLHRW